MRAAIFFLFALLMLFSCTDDDPVQPGSSNSTIDTTETTDSLFNELFQNGIMKDKNGSDNCSEADYFIDSIITVPYGSNYYIEDNVSIEFGKDGGLIVNGDLRLGQNVCFFSNNSWKGIYVEYGGALGGTGSELSVINAGDDYVHQNQDRKAAIFVAGNGILNSGKFWVKNLRVEGSPNYAVVLNGRIDPLESYDYSQSKGYYKWTLIDNAQSARVRLGFLYNTEINRNDKPGSKLEVFGTTSRGMDHYGGDKIIDVNDTIYVDSVIDVQGFINVFGSGSYHTVIKNATILFEENAYLLTEYGEFRNVIFDAAEHNPSGKWNGIRVGDDANFRNCIIRNAGKGNEPYKSAISTFEGYWGPAWLFPTFDSVIIENSGGYGIEAYRPFDYLQRCIFRNNALGHVFTNPLHARFISYSNTFDLNSPAVVLSSFDRFGFGPLSSENLIKDLGVPYHVLDSISPGIMSLEPGVEFIMYPGSYINIVDSLYANGTSSNPIIIRGLNQNRGEWQGLRIGKFANMDHVIIQHAGSTNARTTFNSPFGANLILDSDPTNYVSVTNCQFTQSEEYGLVIKNGSGEFGVTQLSSNNVFEGLLGPFYDDN